MVDSENPYASPLADISMSASPFAAEDVETVRQTYLKHEASVRSVGTLYYIGGAMLGFVALAMLIQTVTFSTMRSADVGMLLVLGLFYVGLAVLSFILGAGLRRLDARVRIPTIVLSAIGLLWVPIGTIINGYILYLLSCAKGKMVFSPYYHSVMAQTPHLKYRTSLLTWILLIFLIVTVVGGVLTLVVLSLG